MNVRLSLHAYTQTLTCPNVCPPRRSVREDPPDAERQASEEEEDHHQEEHAEPLLQRVLQLRGPLRADSGRCCAHRRGSASARSHTRQC